MQLAQVFRRAGRAAWLILAVPLLATLAVTAVLVSSPAEYTTNATVSVIVPQGSDTAATVSQAVDTFQSAVASDTVVQLAVEESGIQLNPSRDITVERVATSNLVELKVTTDRRDNGAEAIRALVEQTNATVFASTLASAQARVDVAEERYQAALDERRTQIARTGLQLPLESYRAKLNEVSQLQVARVTAESDIRRAAIENRLRTARRELQGIGKTLEEYEAAEDRVGRTRAEVSDANEEVDSVNSRLEAASSLSSVSIAESRAESRRAAVVRGIISAVILGLAVATGLILLVGLFRSVPDDESERVPPPSAAPGQDPPGTRDRDARSVQRPGAAHQSGSGAGDRPSRGRVPIKLGRKGRR